MKPCQVAAIAVAVLHFCIPDGTSGMNPATAPVAVRQIAVDTAQQSEPVATMTLPMSMRDGTALATDIYLPNDKQGLYPAILIRTPYGRRSMDLRFTALAFAAHGYAVAVQDVRGRGGSGGMWEPYLHEGWDGYDAVEAVAAQPWCTGAVGMIGSSYLATTQILAAQQRPPHLVTIIPVNLPGDPWANAPYEHGLFFMTPSLWWVASLEMNIDGPMHPRFAELERIKHDPRLSALPVAMLDSLILGHRIPYWRSWIENGTPGQYWSAARTTDALEQVAVPVLLISGWYDTHAIGAKDAAARLFRRRDAVTHLVVGPWNHMQMVPRTPVTQNVGQEAAVDILSLCVQWFDTWLRGKEGTNRESCARLYLLNGRRWIEDSSYPPRTMQQVPLYLNSNGRANGAGGDGRLQWELPEGAATDTFTYDPQDPTPAPAYRFDNGRRSFDSITTHRKDILAYESAPLSRPLTLMGPLRAIVHASSSAVDTDWFVTLYAVTPEGRHIQMVRGGVRARHRVGGAEPLPLTPGTVETYDIDLWHFGVKLEAGCRLRVEIASAYFPTFSRNLNTGENSEQGTEGVAAIQEVHHTRARASCILLPVIAEETEQCTR